MIPSQSAFDIIHRGSIPGISVVSVMNINASTTSNSTNSTIDPQINQPTFPQLIGPTFEQTPQNDEEPVDLSGLDQLIEESRNQMLQEQEDLQNQITQQQNQIEQQQNKIAQQQKIIDLQAQRMRFYNKSFFNLQAAMVDVYGASKQIQQLGANLGNCACNAIGVIQHVVQTKTYQYDVQKERQNAAAVNQYFAQNSMPKILFTQEQNTKYKTDLNKYKHDLMNHLYPQPPQVQPTPPPLIAIPDTQLPPKKRRLRLKVPKKAEDQN